MKIAIVHNAYQLRGGEDSVVDAEKDLLTQHGHTVTLFSRNNNVIPDMPAADVAAQTVWSTSAASHFEALLRSFRPNIVHVHNTFPLISPSIYWVANRLGVPIVQTLHNFRLLCPQGVFLREGTICTRCVGRVPWRAIMYGCYRDSRMQSSVLATMLTLHRLVGTWNTKVTRYIALNEFCRDQFIAGGLPCERIIIKPNYVGIEAPQDLNRDGFLFVGRLSYEKGVHVLVRAAATVPAINIRVVGSGPESQSLGDTTNITPLGALSSQDVMNEMSRAIALVIPSICFESFPRTLVEAFASRLPVIASRLGPIAELVCEGVTGLLFDPGNAQDLAEKMNWAQQHPTEMAQMGRNARAHYEAEFTAERNYQQLMAIYEDAIAEVKSGN